MWYCSSLADHRMQVSLTWEMLNAWENNATYPKMDIPIETLHYSSYVEC